MKIITAILEAANEEGGYGATRAKILYKAFLSYDQLKQYLTILKDNDLLRYNKETRRLKITEKGIRFLQICHKIHNMTEEDSNVKVSSINNQDRVTDREKQEEEQANLIKRKVLFLDNKDNKPLAKVLIVDDDSDIAEVLKHGLETNGFLVNAYTSSREAIDAFKPDVYDLAILDIRMQGLNGIELYRQMKRIDPTITACFLSAFEINPEGFEKMFPSLMEVKAIIKKPVSIQQLLSEIKPLLRISAIRRARRGDHIQAWDGYRPHYGKIADRFFADLEQKKKKELQLVESNDNSGTNSSSSQSPHEIPWMEKLLQTSVEDKRKELIFWVLVPYLATIKQVDDSQTFTEIGRWLAGCDQLRKLQPSRTAFTMRLNAHSG